MNGETGKLIIFAGAILILTGIVIYYLHNSLQWLGNLPGDIKIERENFRLYLPIITMLLLSLLVNILIRIYRWL